VPVKFVFGIHPAGRSRARQVTENPCERELGVKAERPTVRFSKSEGTETMNKKAIKHPDKTSTRGAYSAGISSDRWLYVSGHASQDLKTGEVIGGSTGEETSRTLASIGKVLKEAGCTLDDVVKCTYYLVRIEDFDEFNQAYAKVFTGTLPARTTVQAVLSRRLKVEIDANARIPSQPENVGGYGGAQAFLWLYLRKGSGCRAQLVQPNEHCVSS
jgi:2-iminobutanoate/2-iminopropanoate deaminase